MESPYPHGHCPTVYGPVQSRRHGRSLGVNLGSADQKICTWGCVYCQCGMGQRRDFVDGKDTRPRAEVVLSLVQEFLAKDPSLESITLAGNSEPTTHPDFPVIVDELLRIREQSGSSWTVNCLSNGSQLDRTDVVRACNLLDEAWIKLDCAQDGQFQRLNRPLARVGTVANHVERIQRLQRPRLQTLVWSCPSRPTLSNWTTENQDALVRAYLAIKPALIHLTTIARAPALPELHPIPEAELNAFASVVRASHLQIEVFA